MRYYARMRRTLAGVILFALAVFIGYTLTRPTAHLLSGTRQSDGSLKHIEGGQYYEIDITYPDRTPLWNAWNPAADTRARNEMETWLKGDSAQFLQDIDVADISGPEKESLDENGEKYTYDATYKPFASANGRAISYEYDIYVDTGGAHPNGYFQTFTFDKSGGDVTLASLFAPGSQYLQRLSAIATAQVKSQIGERLNLASDADIESALFADGLTASPDNFANFVIDGSNLVILFPPYQVAPYAAGTFEIRIPLSQLSDMLQAGWK